MPKVSPQTFKYFYRAKFVSKGKTMDKGTLLALDLGSKVFGMASATMPEMEAKLVRTKGSRIVS